MSSADGERGGFSLIELVVALVIAGTMLLTARMMLDRLGQSAHDIIRAAADADREANMEGLLRDLVRRLEVDIARGVGFAGDASTARLTTWCNSPAGWQERCDVVLGFRSDSAGVMLIVHSGSRHPIPALGPASLGRLTYLSTTGSAPVWTSDWGDGFRTPVAIGVVLDRDTVILRIGDRS
jgi:prepilin-type N-terminal cleavage/methylation domain-containing protein